MVLVASVAVALLVMLVLVVLSVMSGLQEQTRQRNHNWSGDVVVLRDSLVGFGYYEEFIEELKKQTRHMYDPVVVDAFFQISSGTAAPVKKKKK